MKNIEFTSISKEAVAKAFKKINNAMISAKKSEIELVHIRSHHEHPFLSIVNTDSYRT